MRLMNVISRKNLTGASLEKVFYCFLFVAGVFCIPSCFISRHVTAGVLGVALLVGTRVDRIKDMVRQVLR